MKQLLLIPLLLLTSCGLFGADMQPALEGVSKMRDVFENQTSAFETLVDDPQNGMTPQVRQFYQDGIARNRAAFADVEQSLVGYLSQVGDVDWQEAYAQLKRIYDQIRSNNTGSSGGGQ